MRLSVHMLRRFRDDMEQIFQPGIILGKQNQMLSCKCRNRGFLIIEHRIVDILFASSNIQNFAGSISGSFHIDFAADNRVLPLFFHRFAKLVESEHVSMIGDSAVIFTLFCQIFNSCNAVQQRIFSMLMEIGVADNHPFGIIDNRYRKMISSVKKSLWEIFKGNPWG